MQVNFSRRALWLLLAAQVTLAGGCRQGQIYQANRLPSELMAAPVANLQNTDLSQLARAAGDTEVLYPGDLVGVSITTGLEESAPEAWQLRINEAGTAEVPIVGAVQLGGLRAPQAEYAIQQESIRRGKYVKPNVTVTLIKRRSNRITVMGAVDEPGTYEVPASQSDLLGALALAGGLNDEAGTIIEIRHPAGAMLGRAGEQTQFTSHSSPAAAPAGTVRVDLAQVDANAQSDLHLYDGSTVMVMKKPKRFIHVIGLVRKPNQFEIPEDTEVHLLDAIAMAGGLTLEVADKVHVIRTVDENPEPVVIEASIKNAKRDGVSNILLAAGDVVSVEETPTTLVLGTIRDFVRFGFTSGIPGF